MLKGANINRHFRKFIDTNTKREFLTWFNYDPDLADIGMCILYVEEPSTKTSIGYEVDVMYPGYRNDKRLKYKWFTDHSWLMEECVEKFIIDIQKKE